MTGTRRKDLSGRHVVRGALVSLGGSIGSRIISFLALAVLARLLLPADFGIVATAMIFIGLFRAMICRQFHLALVRLPVLERSHLDTAFTLSLLWGLACAAALFILADTLAQTMNAPAVAPVLRVMALVLVIESLQSPAFSRFERDLDLRPDVVTDWAGKIAQYTVSIGLAVWWQSHWALVLGFLGFSVFRVGLSYVFAPYLPRFGLSHLRAFLSFGGWLSGTGLAGYAIGFTDITVVALRLGSSSVGLYNMAAEIVRMASDYLAMPLGRAIYPGLATVIEDPARLRRAFLDSVQCLLGLMLPIGVGLALVSSEIVLLLLGENWREAESLLRILSPAAAFATVSFAAQSVVMAEGRTRAMFARNLIVAALQLPLIWYGVTWNGLDGAAAGRACGMVLHGLLSLVIAAPFVGITVVSLLLAPWRSLLSAAAMAAGLVWLDMAMPFDLPVVLTLVIKIALGMLLYGVAHFGLWTLTGRPRGFESFILARFVRSM